MKMRYTTMHQVRRYQLVGLLASTSMILSACTTQLTTVGDVGTPDAPTYGFPYKIPAQVLTLDVSWRLTKCVPSTVEYEANLEFSVGAKVTSETVPGERFLIDYRKMTSAFKTSELKITYFTKKIPLPEDAGEEDEPEFESTGIIKSINANIEGKEPEAIKSAVRIIANVAKGAVALSGGAMGTGPNMESTRAVGQQMCNATTLALIDGMETATGALKKLKEDVKAKDEELTALKLRAVGLELTDNDKAKLDKINDDLERLNVQIKSKSQLSQSATESLTISQKCDISPPGYDFWVSCRSDSTEAKEWLRGLLATDAKAKAPAYASRLIVYSWAERANQAVASLTGSRSGSCSAEAIVNGKLAHVPASDLEEGDNDEREIPKLPSQNASYDGFVYREPVDVRICIRTSRILAAGHAPEGLAFNSTFKIAQLGNMRVLPLPGSFGAKNAIAVVFGRDGTPISNEHSKPVSGGAETLAALGDASATGLGVAETVAKARKERADALAAKVKTPLQLLQDQVALLEAEQKLTALGSPNDPQLAALDAEIEVLKRKRDIALMKAEIAANPGGQ